MHQVQRIGIFGGAFDPPHRAHRAVAQAALSQLDLDELRIVPTGKAWHKARALTDATHRLAMCRLAFGDIDGVVIDTCEIDRNTPSYSIETLEHIQAQRPNAQLVMIVGADQLMAFYSWVRYEDILSIAQLAVAPRGQSQGVEPQLDLSGVDIDYTPLQIPLDAISATEIRQKSTTLADANGPDSVHPEVARYIAQHHLYSKSPT